MGNLNLDYLSTKLFGPGAADRDFPSRKWGRRRLENVLR